MTATTHTTSDWLQEAMARLQRERDQREWEEEQRRSYGDEQHRSVVFDLMGKLGLPEDLPVTEELIEWDGCTRLRTYVEIEGQRWVFAPHACINHLAPVGACEICGEEIWGDNWVNQPSQLVAFYLDGRKVTIPYHECRPAQPQIGGLDVTMPVNAPATELLPYELRWFDDTISAHKWINEMARQHYSVHSMPTDRDGGFYVLMAR